MGIFFKRPLALFCAIFAAASLCGCLLSCENKIKVLFFTLLLALVAVIIFLLWKKRKAVIMTALLCVLFSSLALFLSFLRIDVPQRSADIYACGTHDITATVTEIYYSTDFSSSYQIKINQIDEKRSSVKAKLDLDYNAELKPGDVILLSATIEDIKQHTDTPQSFYCKGIFFYISSSPQVIGQNITLDIRLHTLNQKLCLLLRENIDGECGALVSALVLGNKDLLSSQTIRDFRRAGISHVIAISGMHLSVLMLLFDFVLKKLKINKPIRGAVVILVALFYLALTGFYLSTVRAFIMTAMMYLAFIFKEDGDMLTNLLLSLFVILSISPYAIYDIGLWLSFLAVLGIFTAGYFIKLFSDKVYSKVRPESRYAKKMSPRTARILIYLFSSIIITICANVFICLPAWLYFDEISIVSIISNLIVSPFIFIVLCLSPICVAVSPISFLGNAVGFIIQKICQLLLGVVSYISSFSNITVSLNYGFAKPIVIFLSVSLAICLIFKFKRKWLIAVPPFIAAISFAICLFINSNYYSQILDFEYIGATESEMLILRDGDEHIIIDISSGANAYTYDAYKRSVKNTATEISSFVITHYHNRHQSTLYKLFRYAVVKTLYLPYPQDADEYYMMSALTACAVEANVNVILYDFDSQTNISENLKINLSQRKYLKRSTHPVFYFTLTSPTSQLLFISESATDVFEENLDTVLSGAKTVILGAHGPKTKNNFSFNFPSECKLIIADNNIKNHFEILSDNNLAVYENTAYIKLKFPK